MADEATGTAILHEETLRELGLSEQPFVDGKKPHRFTDSTMQKTRASLEQHTRFGESVHLVLGETGAGKTVLLSQLIKHCKNSLKPFVAKGSEGFVAEAFLTAVLNQLGGEQSETMTGLVESLTPEFAALNEQQFSVLLAIDDAHLAPVEEIAELINVMSEFNADGEITARLLLTGEAKLKSSLDAIAREYEGMTFDPTVSTVSPLSEAQMRDYLSSRLNHAGHTDVFPFTEKALAKLHRESAGLPAEINTGAAHYLNTVYANAAADKAGGGLFATLGWPLVALGTAAVGLIAWGLSMFIGGGDDPDQLVTAKPPTIVANAPVEIKLIEDDTQTTTLAAENSGDATPAPEDLNTAIKDLATTDLQNSEENSGDSLLQSSEQQVASATEGAADALQSAEDTAQDTANTLTSEPLVQNEPAVNDNQLIQNVESDGGDNSAAETAPIEVAESVTEQANQEQINTADAEATRQDANTESSADQNASVTEVTETVIASSQSAPASEPDLNRNNGIAVTTTPQVVAESETVDIKSLTDSDAISIDNSDEGVSVALPSINGNADTNAGSVQGGSEQNEPSTPAISRAVENERWVLFQEPTHFTVQLATSRERNYILELAQGISESPVAIYPFRTTASQNPVFGLLSGLYETRTEAVNAVEEMPNDLKRFGVWIRPISDLQAAIKNNQ